MDFSALQITLELGFVTVIILIPLAIFAARGLAYYPGRGKILWESLVALPLVLPPTVIGFYLLVIMGGNSWIGKWVEGVFGGTLVFHFSGLVLASLLINVPFAVQPIQRAFEAIAPDVRDSASCCGMGFWKKLLTVEIPLAWPGILSGLVLTFAHTLGEFGVVLMVGGNIPGVTRTLSLSIYDKVQSFDYEGAGFTSVFLLALSMGVIALAGFLGKKRGGFRGPQ